ncbi:hypothetical protein T12_4018 [Trichinella patagoniensis]|uniref:Uncharacterized protein n=1 Tax=Trichinella patagoniensis TaxID=990121 RepID=A0A0V0Z0A8_9BILA|nr:hypothetical protein T12_4018 [Trichinella patagoniensis]
MKLLSFVQYFFVLGKLIFLHFPSIWNEFINIVSGRIEILDFFIVGLQKVSHNFVIGCSLIEG